ncbi:uncharacterized protein Dyak_GE27772 [Drosophila yakuba]|uniref:argininosuccinate synthase n=1 Tax=Drosophila yakuba TaxID=7245 RepID=A0A0R1E923_DROYA|nr:uncharacterized protein Dyak_GE27772 [Drosophila yakuba]
MADYVYNGFWFSPEATYDRKCIKLAEQRVSGKVTVELAPGYCRGVSMNVHGGYVPQDAGGFIAINAVRVREHIQEFRAYEVPKQKN